MGTEDMDTGRIIRFLVLGVSLSLLGAGCVRRAETTPPPGGIYRTDDGGTTFVQKVQITDGTNLAGVTPQDVVISPVQPTAVALVASGALFRTTDGGDTWVRARPPAVELSSVSVHPRNPNIILATGRANRPRGPGVIVQTLNGGRSFATVFVAPESEVVRGRLAPRRRADTTQVTVVAHDPFRPENVYAGTSTGTLLHSADGGLHWRSAHAFPLKITGLKFSPYDPWLLLVRLADGRLASSADFGVTFATLAAGRPPRVTGLRGFAPSPEPVHAVLFAPPLAEGNIRLFAGTQSGLYTSSDGGAAWHAVSLPSTGSADVPVRSLARTADGALWAVSGSVLFTSRNEGITWTSVSLPIGGPIRFVVADPALPHRLYLFFGPA